MRPPPPAPEATAAPAATRTSSLSSRTAAATTDDRPDVDGIFARLRSEAPPEPEAEPVADIELAP